MSETDAPRPPDNPAEQPVPEPAEPEMTGPMNTIQGTDLAAVGIEAPTNPAPDGAEVDDTERHLPGPDFGEDAARQEKAWFTTLAFESDSAGIDSDPGTETDEEGG